MSVRRSPVIYAIHILLLGTSLALAGCGGDTVDGDAGDGAGSPTVDVVRLGRLGPEEPPRPALESGHISELTLRRTLGDRDSFGRVFEMLAFDSVLVAADVMLPPYLKVIHLRTGEVVHEFGQRGEGPGEFLSPRALGRLASEPPTFRVYDFQNQRLSTYEWDRAAGEVRSLGHTSFVGGLSIKTPISLPSSGRFLASGLFTDYTLAVVDSTGQPVRGLSIPLPLHPDRPTAVREANLRHFASDPARSKFVVAWQHANRLDILRGPDGPYVSARGPREITVDYEATMRGFQLAEDGEAAYFDVYATNRNIYALLCDCTDSDTTWHGGSHLPRQIHVFGWDGEYRGEIRLDREVLQIAVSPNDSLLWAPYHQTPVPSVGEWRLPPWTRE